MTGGIADGVPVFLFFHGMGYDRTYPTRVEVYKLLSRLGYHVMTIDYRGLSVLNFFLLYHISKGKCFSFPCKFM